jgi:predicted RNA-binding Zn ribbon-like protein
LTVNLPSRAGSLSLVGGILALDFANTRSGLGTLDEIEHLREPVNLLEWAEHVGAVTSRRTRTLRSDLESSPEGQDMLMRARSARQAFYEVGSALAGGRNPPQQSLSRVRDLASETMKAAKLTRSPDGTFELSFRGARAFDAVIGPVALSMYDLLRQGSFERLKQCPQPDCGWLFYDRSKNNSRRWCDMAVCGNRMKAQRHRSRAAVRAEAVS